MKMISSQFAARNGANKAALKPTVLELIRTQHCDTPRALLLDKIHIVVSDQRYSDADAYRVWLSDGANTIQAVFMPDLHPFLTAGDLREGTVLVLTRYKLIKATKYRRQGWVWVLVVSDMEIDGFDGRENSNTLLEFRDEEHLSISAMKVEVGRIEAKTGDIFRDVSPELRSLQSKTRKRKAEPDLEELSSPKPKLRKSNSTLFLANSEARPALGERNANRQIETPTKSIKCQETPTFGPSQRS